MTTNNRASETESDYRSSNRINLAKPFSLKDFLIYVPAAGSAIALSWEVGSFLPVGSHAFMLFSLSEHLQFAVQALPVAMVVAMMTVAALIGGAVLRARMIYAPTRASERIRYKLLRQRFKTMLRAVKWLALLLFLSGLISIAVGYMFRDVTALVLGIASVTVTTIGSRLRLSDLVHMILPLSVALFVFVLVMAFAIGIDQTRYKLKGAETVNFHGVDGVKEAVLLRSGERGALLFDPRTQKFYFEKWEGISDLNWPRRGLFKKRT